MSQTIRKSIGKSVMQYVRKFAVPVGIAFSMIVPNFVYAFDTETNEWKNVQIYGGGMITGINFSPAEKDLIYSRTDMGGVYRWQESSQSWKPLTDWVGPEIWSNLGCDSIATDPSDPERVYALMGEYDNGWTDVHGAVFCSANRGETWEVSELPFFCGSNMQGRLMGERLVVDPNNNAILYLASRNNGLWRSTDYGKTWNEVTSFPTYGDFKYDKDTEYEGHLGLTFVLCDKNSNVAGKGSQIIYVGVGNRDHSIYRSTDGGETWEPLPDEPRGKVVNEATGETAMEAGESYLPYQSYLTKDGIMYITYSTSASPYAGDYYGDVWKFDTKTDKWTFISPKSSKNAPSDPYYGYTGLAVDPQNENNLVVLCQAWWPDMQMYRSTDGGETWKAAWEWTSYPSRDFAYKMDISDAPWLDWGKSKSTAYGAETYPKLGWCVGAVGMDPFNSDRLFYGTGATMYGTDNLTNWDKGGQMDITVVADGIEETVSNCLVVPTEGAQLLSSLYDINGFYHEDVTKVPGILANVSVSDFETLNSSVFIDYAAKKPNIVVRVGERTAIDSYGSYNNGLMWSTDYGKTFKQIYSRIGSSNGKGTVALSADGAVIVWATPDEPVSWSEGGYNWKTCVGIPTGTRVVADREDENVFYAFEHGNFYVSTDKARTFTKTEATGLPDTSMNIKTPVERRGEIWLGSSEGLWFSKDYGKNFTKIEDVNSVTSFGLGKGAEGSEEIAVYMAGKVEGQNGFFRTTDCGDSWVRINDNGHQYGLVDSGCDITGDPNVYGRVYIGTNGRGIVYADTGANTVVVESATISPTVAKFNKDVTAQEDIDITMTLNNKTLNAIKVNNKALASGAILEPGVDYTVNGEVVTISRAFLATLTAGEAQFVFDFNEGSDRTLTVTVVEAPEVTPEVTPEPSVPEVTPEVTPEPSVPEVTPEVTPEPSVPEVTPEETPEPSVPEVTPEETPEPSVPEVTPEETPEPSVPGVTPEETPVAPEASDLKVTVKRSSSTSTNTLSNTFMITSENGEFDLSKLEVRYYYTAEGNMAQTVWVDNAAIQYKRAPWYVNINSSTKAQIVTMNEVAATADSYLSLKFTGTDTIDRTATAEIATRTAKNDWSNYDQSNDYSYDNGAVVLYDGVVISGKLPK